MKNEIGMKARVITLLCQRDPDFKFEYACRGLYEMIDAYTYRELKQLLRRHQNWYLDADSTRLHYYNLEAERWEKVP